MIQSGTPSPSRSAGERIAWSRLTWSVVLARVRLPTRVVLVAVPIEAVIVMSPKGTTAL